MLPHAQIHCDQPPSISVCKSEASTLQTFLLNRGNDRSPSDPGALRSRPPSCQEAVGGPTPLLTLPSPKREAAPSWEKARRSQSPPHCVYVSPSASSPFDLMFHSGTSGSAKAGGQWWSVWPQMSFSGQAGASVRSHLGVLHIWNPHGFYVCCTHS